LKNFSGCNFNHFCYNFIFGKLLYQKELSLQKIFITMATIGTKLLNLRNKHKLSQMEVAEKLQVSQNAYHKWESDKCKPTADNLKSISEYYNIDISELLDDNEKISLSHNKIKGENNIIANTIPTINIQPRDLVEKVMQNQEQIFKIIENQNKLLEEVLKKR
jgi:transcriptional regulator with XRE-family HTH domain